MKTTPRTVRFWSALALVVLSAAVGRGATSPDEFAGRWALDLAGGSAGWLEISPQAGWYDGSLLWGGGSVLPVASVNVSDGQLTVTRLRNVERKSSAGVVVRTHQLTDVITAEVSGDTLKGVLTAPRIDG